MTGFRDKTLIADIVAVGGEMGSGVSKNTFIVLVKDKKEETGKVGQAKKLGVTLMTPTEFKEILLNKRYYLLIIIIIY